jgi:hypothetical protein
METDDRLSFLDIPRDGQGRFAPKETTQPAPDTPPPPASPAPPEPQAQPAPEAASPSPGTPPPGWIPMAAVLDEREKRQKFERELEDYKRKVEELTRQAPEVVDPIADPEAFNRHIQHEIARARWDAITSVSYATALRHHGADKVKQAEEWLQQELQSNPGLFANVQRQPDPYDFVVQQHQRTLRLSKIGDDDPEAWAQKWAEANGYVKAMTQPGAGGAAPIPPTAPLPRPSLASAPSVGGKSPHVPQGPGSAFDAVFKS